MEPEKAPDQHDLKVVPSSLANSAGFLLGRAARIVREMTETALEPLQLSPRELGVMRIIEDEGPLSQHALGKRHNLDRTTVVQVIDGLAKREFLTRIANEQDRRSNLLFLTTRGKKTLAAANKITTKLQTSFLSPLDDAEWQSLKAILIKLIEHHLPES
jgi:DNA-binding MarR family transcriptional regulator